MSASDQRGLPLSDLLTPDHGLSKIRAKLADVEQRVNALTVEEALPTESVDTLQTLTASLTASQRVSAGMALCVADLVKYRSGPYIEVKRSDFHRRAEALGRESEASAAAMAGVQNRMKASAAAATAAAREIAQRRVDLDRECDALTAQEKHAVGMIAFDQMRR